MPISFTVLFPSRPYITPPEDFLGFAAWFVFVFGLIIIIRNLCLPLPNKQQKNWWFYYVLAFFVPFSIILGGITFNNALTETISPLFEGSNKFFLFLFFAIPWQLAAGFFGVLPASIIGLISGISISWWGTHNLYSIVETVGMAVLFSFLIRQKYRTPFFGSLRIPVISAVFTGLVFLPILIINQMLNSSGSLAVRIDHGLTQSIWMTLSRMIELLIGGLVCTIFYVTKQKFWYIPKFLSPTPMEKRIEYRFLMTTLPVILLVVLFVIFVDWIVAGNAAKELVETRLKGSAEIASKSLPHFFESGQNLIIGMADTELLEDDTDVWNELSDKIQTIPFFTHLYLFDENGVPKDGYPIRDVQQLQLSIEEETGIELALKGVHFQIYASPPRVSDKSIQISFISSIVDAQSNSIGVLIGRTDFNSNPYVQPTIATLNLFSKENGESVILDDQRRIIYHSEMDPQLLWAVYKGEIPVNSGLFEDSSVNNIKQHFYHQPLAGRSWSIIVGLPSEDVQELALKISAPLLGVLGLVVILVVITLLFGLRPITNSVKTLSQQAAFISQGDLDKPMKVNSVDELGQLAFSFEQMRIRLRDRLQELKQLLLSSQSVSKHLDIFASIQPILEATMKPDASHARVVLIQEVTADQVATPFVTMGIGKENEAIVALDKQLFEMMRFQDVLPVPNLSRFKRFTIPGGFIPGSILAIALHHENQYFGVIWTAYPNPRTYKDEEIQYMKTLASQAAMASANAKLYSTAELGRQRFEAVLNSTPDPVMVFDESNRLILINPAAKQLGGLFKDTTPGLKLDDVIENEELLELLRKDTVNRDTSREIHLTNRRVFFTTVSSVIRNEQLVGRVCLLRDITHFKEVDTFKSDIVSMVSHDLRSPLTLMRGYASMLQMVGEINEQQRSYVAKIVSGVDSMSRLVNNLLDLGRIEAGIGLKIERTNPIGLAEQVVLELQPHANQKNIELILEYNLSRDLSIEADSALVQQALYNVVENALKYNSLGGNVKVTVSSDVHHATFEIIDNGIGIAPIDLPHLFEKFYRSGRREAYNQRGTGLGLAIVKSIIEKHKGKVWVESKLGRGSSFYLQLPIKQSPVIDS
ncbi:MAG: ATP-binding protein [Anaerolineaceae bacterium]|nr:ATP-binding protein [Anaerolineaceae bacterium]